MPGFSLKPTKQKIEKADEDLKKRMSAAEETVTAEASSVTTATREMFKAPTAEKKVMGGPGTAPVLGFLLWQRLSLLRLPKKKKPSQKLK